MNWTTLTRNRESRRGQTMVEYTLMLALVSLVVMSTIQEVGYYAKGQIVSTECALIWAQYNLSGGEARDNIDRAYEEVKAYVYRSLDGDHREEAIRDKILAKQLKNKERFLENIYNG